MVKESPKFCFNFQMIKFISFENLPTTTNSNFTDNIYMLTKKPDFSYDVYFATM